jgi:hypothetical protein
VLDNACPEDNTTRLKYADVADSVLDELLGHKVDAAGDTRGKTRGSCGKTEGTTVASHGPPALPALAIKFPKDNGIDQPARTGNKVDTRATLALSQNGSSIRTVNRVGDASALLPATIVEEMAARRSGAG